MNANNQQYNYQMHPNPVVSDPYRRPKNKFLTFVCALVPGAGQMYHGLMKRGISIMLLFTGVIAIAALAYLTVLIVLLPVIWFYSFFDTINRMNMTREELAQISDGFLFVNEQTERVARQINESRLAGRIFKERHLIIGWGLIILAGWITLRMLFGGWLGYHFWTRLMPENLYYLLRGIVEEGIPTLILPVLCVIIGVRLIAGDSRKKPVYNEYTIPKSDGTTVQTRGPLVIFDDHPDAEGTAADSSAGQSKA